MRRYFSDGLIAMLVFVSGLIWMAFGGLLVVGFAAGMFGGDETPFPGLIVPVFGLIAFDFAFSWLHLIGFLLAPLLCIAIGMAICLYLVPVVRRH